MAVSDSPIVVDKERWRRVLTAYRIEGVPVLDLANRTTRNGSEKSLPSPTR